jgi:hypothetical protein
MIGRAAGRTWAPDAAIRKKVLVDNPAREGGVGNKNKYGRVPTVHGARVGHCGG